MWKIISNAMKTEIDSYKVKLISIEEMKSINGGGEWWFWLGETIHKFMNLCNKIEKANIEAPVSVAEWN